MGQLKKDHYGTSQNIQNLKNTMILLIFAFETVLSHNGPSSPYLFFVFRDTCGTPADSNSFGTQGPPDTGNNLSTFGTLGNDLGPGLMIWALG